MSGGGGGGAQDCRRPARDERDLGGGADLYQLGGSLNGVVGRFEWIVDKGKVTHRMFVPHGNINGVPVIP